MTLRRCFVFLICLCSLPIPRLAAVPAIIAPAADARRLEILFLGAPTENGKHHDPITRYRVAKKALGVAGINFTYSQDLAEALRPEFLQQFDAVLFYANWPTLAPDQEKALFDYIAGGRGFLPIHCASACFGHSDAFIDLVGARFKRHGGEVFAPVNLPVGHPILKGLEKLEAWDETYEHDRHNTQGRTVLQVRRDPKGDEPWSWVRTHGAGRIFYTASGHDHRVWDLPEFHALLRNAIVWAVGDETAKKLERLRIPELPQQDVLLPGYKERKAITKAQVALSPEDSAKLIQVPPGFEVSLFVCEPDIVNPIYVAWDHRGRAFVIETVDYPNNLQDGNLGHDRIKICEDTDGDGRADKFTVFADRLSIPTSLTFARGGVICTNGTELLYLRDTNGDDVADVREKLIDGFSMNDTHAGPSNLRYGFDNWLYATIGYAGFEGQVGGVRHNFSQGVFRFRPDGRKIEFLQGTTNNTWGLGFSEEFNILGSTANANPSWVHTVPVERYEAFGLKPQRTPRADDNPFFNPSSMDIRQVDVHDRYTSAAGHALYTARRFPADYWNRVAFVTEPTGKLVGVFDLTSDGASFDARQRPNNIFNSADAWTSPVCAEVGPDGALWICDWYNLIIQHNPTPSEDSAGMDAKRGKGNAYQTPLRDSDYGRVWRVYPKGSNSTPAPRLDPARAETLVAALNDSNLFWRLSAQRLLVENHHQEAADQLRALAAGKEVGAVHALQALAGIGQADETVVAAGLKSPQFAVRRAAREIAARAFPELVRAEVLAGGLAKVPAGGAREWMDMFIAVSRLPAANDLGAEVFRAAEANEEAFFKDPVLIDAWRIAARAQVAGTTTAALGSKLSGDKNDKTLSGQALELIAWAAERFPSARATLGAEAARRDSAFARQAAEALKTAGAASDGKPRQHAPDPVVHKKGAAIYATQCASCHGQDGLGVAGAFPPLSASERLTKDPSVPIRIVLHGLQGPITAGGKEYNGAMPPPGNLSDADISAVLTYLRQSFGNDAASITEAQVKATRARYTGRREMWKAAELQRAAP